MHFYQYICSLFLQTSWSKATFQLYLDLSFPLKEFESDFFSAYDTKKLSLDETRGQFLGKSHFKDLFSNRNQYDPIIFIGHCMTNVF